MQETPVQFLGREGPLENGQATHSSILAWRIPWSQAWLRDFHFTFMWRQIPRENAMWQLRIQVITNQDMAKISKQATKNFERQGKIPLKFPE